MNQIKWDERQMKAYDKIKAGKMDIFEFQMFQHHMANDRGDLADVYLKSAKYLTVLDSKKGGR